MSSVESANPLRRDQELLLDIADSSLASGLKTGQPLTVDPQQYSPLLQSQRATFVTLRCSGQLRGCMGSLDAQVSLVQDVAKNAFLAGFRDPRFKALTRREFTELEISISVLCRPERVEFDSEVDLIQRISPGIDGLVLREHDRRGTLLPSVWAHIPQPENFLRQLKQKAGLAEDYWSPAIEVQRYTTDSFHRKKARAYHEG